MAKPLFAVRLEAKRQVRGLTQEQLAIALNVSRNTIHRWENGEGMPTGKHTPGLMRELGFTIGELDQLHEQFLLNEERAVRKYHIGGYEFVYENYPTWESFLDDLIELDLQEMKDLSLSQEGTSDHWAPIFERNPSTWRILIYQNRVVGYWHYLLLKSLHLREQRRVF